MGRYVSGGSGSQPRRLIVQVPVSNPSIPIPLWAQNGKSIVEVTGCGAGASGGIGELQAASVGGGAGANALRYPMNIPAGVTSLAALIGVGAAAVTAAARAPGNIGGATTLTVGVITLRLNGGGNNRTYGGSNDYSHNSGGIPTVGNNDGLSQQPGGPSTNFLRDYQTVSGYAGPASALSCGANGGEGSQSGGYGNGGASPWGSSPIRQIFPGANQNGGDATGLGAGGQSAYWASGPAVTSGRGANGFLTLEFIEGN